MTAPAAEKPLSLSLLVDAYSKGNRYVAITWDGRVLGFTKTSAAALKQCAAASNLGNLGSRPSIAEYIAAGWVNYGGDVVSFHTAAAAANLLAAVRPLLPKPAPKEVADVVEPAAAGAPDPEGKE